MQMLTDLSLTFDGPAHAPDAVRCEVLLADSQVMKIQDGGERPSLEPMSN